MQIKRQDLDKSLIELVVELSVEEFAPYIEKGAIKVSEEVKIEGFRPGKVPYDILKQKIGEMTILEEAAHLVIHKTIDEVVDEHVKDKQIIGQPKVEVTKLAPNNPFEYKISLVVLPEITLGKYKELGVKQDEVKVKDEDVKKSLQELAEMRAKEVLSDQPAKNSDKVLIGLEMFLDKVPVENGQMPELVVILGKEYFVPGFDKKIVGAKKDEVLEFSLPYPDDHHLPNLAGKMVDFKVKIKEIYSREIPALDDELAKLFGFKKFAELEDFMRHNISHKETERAEQKSEIAMLDKILEGSKFGEIPEMLIQNESELMMSELEQALTQQGGKMDDYLASIKKTKEQLVLDLLPNAVKRVKVALLMREIARAEKVIISEEEIDKKLAEIKEQYKQDNRIQEMIKQKPYRSYLGNMLANQKVIKQLREWNIS